MQRYKKMIKVESKICTYYEKYRFLQIKNNIYN